MMKYRFSDFVENKSFIEQEDVAFILENLTQQEMYELLEVDMFPNFKKWGRAGLRGIGNVARGIYNIPNQVRAGFHGIDTDKYKVGTPEFQQQLQSKQYGLDPSKFQDVSGNFDQKAFNNAVAKAKFRQMNPEQQQQFYQTKANTMKDRLGQQTSIAQAKNQLTQARNSYQQSMNPSSFVDQIERALTANGTQLSNPVKGALTQLRKALLAQTQQTQQT